MRVQDVPVSLRERLGVDAASDFAGLLDVAGTEWNADMVNASLERFDRRLVEESSRLRIEIAARESALRDEMSRLRIDMQAGFAQLRDDIAKDRFELLKWSFYFWVGQFFASAALMTALVGAIRSR